MRLTTIILMLVLLNHANMFACTCPPNIEPITKADYDSLDAIFIGKVIQIEEVPSDTFYFDGYKFPSSQKAVTFNVIEKP